MEKAILEMMKILVLVVVVINCVSALGDAQQKSFGQYPASDDKYQDWYEWMVKRNFGNSYGGLGSQENRNRFVNWGDVFNNAMAKRQLSISPNQFGNHGGYFSHGLQDWRRAFAGSKRQAGAKRAD